MIGLLENSVFPIDKKIYFYLLSIVTNLLQIQRELRKNKDPEQAKILGCFFKTGKGEYGEGDVFWGIKVPVLRKIAKQFKGLPLEEVAELLRSKIHEYRLTALLILISQFKKGTEKEKFKIVCLYLGHTQYVNNWDLVDLSAPKILGAYYLDKKDRKIFLKLAKSRNLWKRRVAILSSYAWINENDFKDALKIAEFLLRDKEDLIHKAVGWMLREIGKRDRGTEEKFLKKYYQTMPRTMLRYAIEKFPEKKKKIYMARK